MISEHISQVEGAAAAEGRAADVVGTDEVSVCDTAAGLDITQVYRGSHGMGLGSSVLVDASFDVTRQAIESELGKGTIVRLAFPPPPA